MSSWASLSTPAQDRTGWQSLSTSWDGPGPQWQVGCGPSRCLQVLLLGASHPVLLLPTGLQVHPRGLWVGLHAVTCGVGTGANSQVPGAPVFLSVRGRPARWRMWRTQASVPAPSPVTQDHATGRLPNLTWKRQMASWVACRTLTSSTLGYEGFTKCSESCGGGKKG